MVRTWDFLFVEQGKCFKGSVQKEKVKIVNFIITCVMNRVFVKDKMLSNNIECYKKMLIVMLMCRHKFGTSGCINDIYVLQEDRIKLRVILWWENLRICNN